MKTSNKILFSFTGFIVFMMIVSDAVLWANYKNGMSGGKPINEKKRDNLWTEKLPSFKVVKIVGTKNQTVTISRADSAMIIFENKVNRYNRFEQRGDTVVLRYEPNLDFRMVQCPDLSTVILVNASAYISGMALEGLKVLAEDSSAIRVVDTKIGRLDIKTGKYATVELNNSSEVDSLNLALGEHSVLYSYDVPLRYTHLRADSLRDLQLTGRSLYGMKEIK